MRIAISGSAGIGKSSLAKALADRLGLSLITENYEAVFDKSNKLNSPEQLATVIMQIFSSKQQLEEQYGNFVTDRCPVDLFHFWMKMGLWVRKEETDRLYNIAVQQVVQYDLLVVPPHGVFEVGTDHEAGDSRKRASNRYVQMYNHASIIGLAILWVPANHLLFLPNVKQSIDERVEEVINALKTK